MPVAGELLGQVRRGASLQAVLDVVHDVGRGEQDLRREVAQRHVQHQRVVLEPRKLADVRLAGHGGEDDQVAGADQVLGPVVDVDPARRAGARLDFWADCSR